NHGFRYTSAVFLSIALSWMGTALWHSIVKNGALYGQASAWPSPRKRGRESLKWLNRHRIIFEDDPGCNFGSSPLSRFCLRWVWPWPRVRASGKKAALPTFSAAPHAAWPFAAPDSWNSRLPSRLSTPARQRLYGASLPTKTASSTPQPARRPACIE